MLELKWLHDFVSLAGTGNFSRSAEDRNVTQSAFSRRIKSLENWLGTELVDRKTHPVRLTDAGIRFLQPAKNMIRQAELVKRDFGPSRDFSRKTLTFTSATNLAISFLPQWIGKIQQEVGSFNIKVQTDVSGIHDHFEALRMRQTDFLLHYGHGLSMLAMDAGKFEHIVVGGDILVPVCHKSLAAAGVSAIETDSKEPLPYISPWRTSSVAYLISEKILQQQPSLRLDVVVESSIVGCTKSFVAQGKGLAWLPISAVKNEIERGEFHRIANAEFEIPIAISLYRLASDAGPSAAKLWEYVKASHS